MGVLPERYNKTADHRIRRFGARRPGPTEPEGAAEGDMWYQTTTDRLFIWNGTAWIPTPNTAMFGRDANGLAGGATPAVTGSTPFKFQAGTRVATTSLGGDVTLTYPVAFPTGLLSVVVTEGDTTVPNAVIVTHSHTAASSVIRVFNSTNGAAFASVLMRFNWIAIGW